MSLVPLPLTALTMFCSVPNHTRSEATGFTRPRDSGMLLNVSRRGWCNIYISMGIKTSIDLTRATVISSGVRIGAVMCGRRDAQISSHITESKRRISLIRIIVMWRSGRLSKSEKNIDAGGSFIWSRGFGWCLSSSVHLYYIYIWFI